MAKRRTRRSSTRTRTRTVYRTRTVAARARRRVRSYVSRNPTKTIATGVGALAAGYNVAKIAAACIGSRSLAPAAIMAQPAWLIDTGKNAVVGYALGYAGGALINKVGPLKRVTNKILKKVGAY